MSKSRRIAAKLCLLVALATSATAEVRLEIKTPPGYERVAARIRSIPAQRFDRVDQLIGAESGTAIHLMLASESSAPARAVPGWVAGFAIPEYSLVVLFPARSATYPNDELQDVVLHEVAHLLIARATADRPIPRWFNEGVAMFAATGWDLEDRTRLTVAMLSGERVPFRQLDRQFSSDPASVARAYAISGAFVRMLVQRHGSGVIAEILRLIARGTEFDEAFRQATGQWLDELENDFWKSQTLWSRWIPLLSSSIVIWILVTLLAVFAIAWRRRRDAERLRAWKEEEPEEEFNRYNPPGDL